MVTYRSSLLISVFLAVALASACQSDDDDASSGAAGGGASAGGASGAAAGGATSHAGGGGRGGTEQPEAGAAGAELPGVAGSAGDANGGSANGGAGGDTGRPGDAGSAGNAGSAGDAGDPNASVQRYAYVSTFLNGLSPVSIDPSTGKLSKLSVTPVNPGAQLYAVSVDPAQRFVYTAAQTTNKISTYAIAADGSLPAEPNSSTTIAGRPTSLTLDAQGRFAYVASSDEDKSIYTFKIAATTGVLTAVGEPLALEATSPAYVAADPSGQFVYVTQNGAFGIRGYRVDQTTGALTELAGSPFGPTEVLSGAIVFHPAGRFLFTSRNGLNAFALDANTGALTLVEGSPFAAETTSDPSATNLAIDPRGKYLYATNFVFPPAVFGFAIDANTGKLTPVPGGPISGGAPYSLGVEPSGRFVFVGDDFGTTSVFSLQRSDGTLHEIEGSPFAIGGLQPEFAFATAR